MFVETIDIHDPSSVRSDMWRIMADTHLLLDSDAHATPTEFAGLLGCPCYKHSTPSGVDIHPEL
jgi:hypothetical protein